MVRLLAKYGIESEVAFNGKQALELLGPPAWQHAKYDFVLMDLEMDVMNGHESTQRIRQLGISTPIVALSGVYLNLILLFIVLSFAGSCLDEDRAQCVKEGMNGFLSKPLIAKDLEEILRKFGGKGVVMPSTTSPTTAATTLGTRPSPPTGTTTIGSTRPSPVAQPGSISASSSPGPGFPPASPPSAHPSPSTAATRSLLASSTTSPGRPVASASSS